MILLTNLTLSTSFSISSAALQLSVASSRKLRIWVPFEQSALFSRGDGIGSASDRGKLDSTKEISAMRLRLILLSYFLCCVSAAAESISFRSEVLPSNFTATIGGDLAFPKGSGPFPVVILLHPCGGLDPIGLATLQAHSRELRSNGFGTLILDSYGPRNLAKGKACKTFPTGFLRRSDAFNAMAALQSQPKVSKDNIFLLGLSDGGNAAIISAKGGGTSGQFRAVAAYYPACEQLQSGIGFSSPTIVFVGEKDDWTPAAGCLKSKSPEFGAEIKVVSYPNAHHGFDQQHALRKYKGHTLAFDGEATIDSRKKYLEFFKKYLTAAVQPHPAR